MQKSFLAPLLRNHETPCILRNLRNGRTLADRIVPALDSQSRRKGLLEHQTFPRGEALIIAPSNAIHMFFMRFSIDVVFARRSGEVVTVKHGLKPWRIAVSPRAYLVIELPTGTVLQTDTRPGDMLAIVPAP